MQFLTSFELVHDRPVLPLLHRLYAQLLDDLLLVYTRVCTPLTRFTSTNTAGCWAENRA
jgi:hypothetical protein